MVEECGKVPSGSEVGYVGDRAEQCGGSNHANTRHGQKGPAYRVGFGKHRQFLVDVFKSGINRFIFSDKSRKKRTTNPIEDDIASDQFISHKGLELRPA